MNIQLRQQAEKSIVKALAKTCFDLANSQGTCIYVDDGEDCTPCNNPSQVWNAVGEVDESIVIVKNLYTGTKLASFWVVLGNDGYDCIADYSSNEFADRVIKAVNLTCDKWEKKLG